MAVEGSSRFFATPFLLPSSTTADARRERGGGASSEDSSDETVAFDRTPPLPFVPPLFVVVATGRFGGDTGAAMTTADVDATGSTGAMGPLAEPA